MKKQTVSGLFIGLNAVNPDKYDGWGGELACAENDANTMARRFMATDVKVKTLIGSEATIENMSNALARMAQSTADVLVVFFSGHGANVSNHAAICLHDGLLYDHQFHTLIANFEAKSKKKVYIFDSCHSGGMDKSVRVPDFAKRKAMPKAVANYFASFTEFDYDRKDTDKLKGVSNSLSCAACRFDEYAYDGKEGGNSLYTEGLLKRPMVSLISHISDAQAVCADTQHPQAIARGMRKPVADKLYATILF